MTNPVVQRHTLKVTATLAEYTALRAEIQYRSEYQHRILQIHIALFSVIIPALVAAVSTAATQVPSLSVLKELTPWIVLIIPIEASLFGLWYVDHGITIGRLGEFIRTKIETRMEKLLGSPDYLNWETYNKTGTDVYAAPRFGMLLFVTFSAPAFLALLVTSYYLFWISPTPYSAVSWYFALALGIIGGLIFVVYIAFWIYLQRAFVVEGKPQSQTGTQTGP